MTETFDHSRAEVFGTGVLPRNKSNNAIRPLITPASRVLIHYGGAGTHWTDLGDTADELRNLQDYAYGAGKPWEYNVIADSAAETWEYAGNHQAAHNGPGDENGDFGNNDALAILCLYGLEDLDEATASKFIEGTRRARAQMVRAGWLTPNHEVDAHGNRRRGGTACPGPLWANPDWWARIVAPLSNAPTPPTPPAPTPVPDQESNVKIIYKQDSDDDVMVIDNGHVIHCDGPMRDAYLEAGAKDLRNVPDHPSVLSKLKAKAAR